MANLEQEIGLDPPQLAAATLPDGRWIVRAGAGTGKTRCLVERMGHLVAGRGIAPDAVTAVTFTNKASREILERLSVRLPGSRLPVVGTFHSLACRILRAHHEAAGLPRRFMIADDDDRLAVVREAVSGGGVSVEPADLLRRFDSWKAAGLSAAEAADPARPRRSFEDETAAGFYADYVAGLRRRNLLDFGDLVLEAVLLMERRPEVGREIAAGVLHLLVDEGQDANPVQVRFARLLSRLHGNVYVVGDEDQSIYSFQGGRPGSMEAIAGAEAGTVRLERNRRSTDEILRPAVRLVSRNRGRSGKVLSSGMSGTPPNVEELPNELAEASFLAGRIKELLRDGVDHTRIAVLVRSAYVVPKIEEALVRASVPYEMVGGVPLSVREEVRDVAAFMRLACNPFDDLAFRRIANKPTRGIGPAALEQIAVRAVSSDLSMAEACARLTSEAGFVPATRAGLDRLAGCLSWMEIGFSRQGWSTSELVDYVLGDEGFGYEAFATRGADAASRRRTEMLGIVRRLADEEDDPAAFLERLSLETDEALSERRGLPAVRISTMHASKGLEWDYVFLPAFENGVAPAAKANVPSRDGDPDDRWSGMPVGGEEEERRLAHVAMTRARLGLFVSHAASRRGRASSGSRFLFESGLVRIAREDFGFSGDGALSKMKGRDLGLSSSSRVRPARKPTRQHGP